MTKEELIARAEEAKRNGKIIPCGKEAADKAKVATMMRTKAILERKQNG